MKKETGIILLLVGFIVGFGVGMVITTAMRPATRVSAVSGAMQQQQAGLPLPSPDASPDSYAASMQADQKAAEKARLLESIKQLKYMLQSEPENVEVLVGLGNSYFDVGQHYAAIDAYQKALSVNPNMPDVFVDLGIMYRRTGSYDKAVEHFEKAINIDPKHSTAHLNKAVIYRYDLGDYQIAFDLFTKFLELAPSNHPMLPNAKGEIAFLSDELKKGNKGPGQVEKDDHEGHNHPPGVEH
jgi:tetratricopeptide (TPR) repeat protein